MSDFHYHQMQRSMDRAQRAYDNQMPPDDDDLIDCNQCGEEYEAERDDDGCVIYDICEKCRKLNEEGPQT